MKLKRVFIFFIIILLLAMLSYFYPKLTGESVKEQQSSYKKEQAYVVRVIDGDTIETDKGNIRLLGINTPEKNKPNYQEAKDFLKEIEGKNIEILRDKTDIDKYERKLRYVFYKDRLINVEILENGQATSFMIKGLFYEEKLRNAENFAKNNKIGLWEESSDKCSSCIRLAKLEPIEDYFIIENSCSFNCDLTGWLVKDDANHFFKIKSLKAFGTEKYNSTQEIWNDEGDRFFMRDEWGKLVVFYEYP
jgi:micrococcal nuclease